MLLTTGFIGAVFVYRGLGHRICSFAAYVALPRVREDGDAHERGPHGHQHARRLLPPVGQGGVEHDAWGFFLVCAPIVCFGAPLGSVAGSMVHRLVLAWAVYITDAVQLIGALVIVEPWVKVKDKKDDPAHLTASSAAIMVAGIIVFWLLTKFGEKLIEWNEKIEANRRDGGKGKDLELQLQGGGGDGRVSESGASRAKANSQSTDVFDRSLVGDV